MKHGLTGAAVAVITIMALYAPALAHDSNMMSSSGMGGQHQLTPEMMAPGYANGNRMPMMGQGAMMPQMMQMMPRMMRRHHGGYQGGHHGGHGAGSGMHMGAASGMPGGGYGIRAERELDVAAVTKVLTGNLAWTGNTRLKVGKVEEKDDDIIVAEIVTLDGSLVDRLAVHRRSGAMRRLP